MKRSIVYQALLLAAVLALCLPALPAGSTPGAGGFDTWILLQNPADEPTDATISFSDESGDEIDRTVSLPANSRRTVLADDSLEGSFATRVTSERPVIAERAEYFDYAGGVDGGHSSTGQTAPSRKWYFAEGCVGDDFDEWLLVMNQGDRPTTVDFLFTMESGERVRFSDDISPRSRYTLDVESVPGIGSGGLATTIESEMPVFAERAMYFNYEGCIEGGDVVKGARAPANDWFFAEGCVGTGFETWLLLMNPNDKAIEAQVYWFCRPG